MSSVSELESIAFLAINASFGFALVARSLEKARLLGIPLKNGWDRIAIILCFIFALIKYWDPPVLIGFMVDQVFSLAVLFILGIAAFVIRWKDANKGVKG